MSDYEGEIYRRREAERLEALRPFQGRRVTIEFILDPLAVPVVTRQFTGKCLGVGRVMSGAHIPSLVMEMEGGAIVIWPSTAIRSIRAREGGT